MLPKVLLEHRLDWEHSVCDRYRLVAVPTKFGFNGVDYVIERFEGEDALGIKQWKQEECNTSMAIAAIGQYLLEKEND